MSYYILEDEILMTEREKQFELEKNMLMDAVRQHTTKTGHPECETEFDKIKGKFGVVKCCSCEEVVFFSGTGQDS